MLYDPTVGDVNRDATVSVLDLTTIANYLAGNITALPLGAACPQ